MTPPTAFEERILILMPWGRDGSVVASALRAEGFGCHVLQDFDQLNLEIRKGAGAAIVTEEALHKIDISQVLDFLAEQETWSDFPFVVLVGKQFSDPRGLARHWDELGNVILLERPLNMETLRSAMKSVARARRRQYQAREDLIDRTATARSLSESQANLIELNEKLEAHVSARTRQLALANDRLTHELFERERVQQALLHSQKMEAVGRLTGGIAHDFNNLLNVVQGSMDLILLLSADEMAKKRADVARRACERGAKLTQQLLAFSRNQTLNLQAVRVQTIFAGVRELVIASAGSRIDVRFDVDEAVDCVLADANQMEMALLNLAINARDAMPDGGRLTFSARNIGTVPDELPSGRYVRIAVEDNGEGMPPEVLGKVFEPFFTTKEIGRGTGLGLSQVYGMARQSGGLARAFSQVGEGTSIEIVLPCAGADQKMDSVDRGALRRARGGTRILLVEDDHAVRQQMAESLEAIGYAVRQACDGEAALRSVQESTPDLIISDYMMPGISGAELIREVRRRAPAIPMVIATGYADMHAVEELIGQEMVLRKPFPLAELAAVVERAIERAAHT